MSHEPAFLVEQEKPLEELRHAAIEEFRPLYLLRAANVMEWAGFRVECGEIRSGDARGQHQVAIHFAYSAETAAMPDIVCRANQNFTELRDLKGKPLDVYEITLVSRFLAHLSEQYRGSHPHLPLEIQRGSKYFGGDNGRKARPRTTRAA